MKGFFRYAAIPALAIFGTTAYACMVCGFLVATVYDAWEFR